MSNIRAKALQLKDVFLDGVHKIDRNEVDARVRPIIGQPAARRHYDSRPVGQGVSIPSPHFSLRIHTIPTRAGGSSALQWHGH